MSTSIVAALNSLGGGQWALANPWSTSHYWCGLNVYRSDRWTVEWREEVGITQEGDARGICGALLKRKSDGRKLCVWGTHPIYRNGFPAWPAMDAVGKVASAMQTCSSQGAPSVFMGDMNTRDDGAVTRQLESSTGWGWSLAAKGYHGIDHIHIQTSPASAGSASGATTIAPWGYIGERKGEWGSSDHPPIYVDLA